MAARLKKKKQPGQGGTNPPASTNKGGPPGGLQYFPSCAADSSEWYCYGFGETYGQSYNGSVEHGNDNDTPFHTTLTALYGGTITDASYHPWGGQVGVQTTIQGLNNNQPLIYYMQHLDDIDPQIQVGGQILSGQVVGLSGGQIGYGDHPEDPRYTSGPHTETGFGAPWIGGSGNCSFGQPCNPNSNFAFQQARAGQLPMNIPGGSGLPPPPWGFNPCSIPPFSWFCPGSTIQWQDIFIRILLVVVGAILILIGFNKIFDGGIAPPTQQPAQQAAPEGKEEGKPKEAESKEAESSEVEEATVA